MAGFIKFLFACLVVSLLVGLPRVFGRHRAGGADGQLYLPIRCNTSRPISVVSKVDILLLRSTVWEVNPGR